MINFTNLISTEQIEEYRHVRNQMAPNLEMFWMEFLYETDQKIREQTGLIQNAMADVKNVEKRTNMKASFKAPNGYFSKLLFIFGTVLGITILHNLWMRVEAQFEYNHEVARIMKQVEGYQKNIQEFHQFRKTKLKDTYSFSLWNVGFTKKEEFNPLRTAAETLEQYKKTPLDLIHANADLRERIKAKPSCSLM